MASKRCLSTEVGCPRWIALKMVFKADADQWWSKKSGRFHAAISPLGAFPKKKENAMNFGKLAMLHRMAGCIPILLYSSPREEDVKKLFHYLQSLCNGSGDLVSRKDAILCKNPFLAHHLKEIICKQKIVPPSDESLCIPGSFMFLWFCSECKNSGRNFLAGVFWWRFEKFTNRDILR